MVGRPDTALESGGRGVTTRRAGGGTRSTELLGMNRAGGCERWSLTGRDVVLGSALFPFRSTAQFPPDGGPHSPHEGAPGSDLTDRIGSRTGSVFVCPRAWRSLRTSGRQRLSTQVRERASRDLIGGDQGDREIALAVHAVPTCPHGLAAREGSCPSPGRLFGRGYLTIHRRCAVGARPAHPRHLGGALSPGLRPEEGGDDVDIQHAV